MTIDIGTCERCNCTSMDESIVRRGRTLNDAGDVQ